MPVHFVKCTVEEALRARYEQNRFIDKLSGDCMTVDLNADLGEGCANDEALLQLLSSAKYVSRISCG